MWDNQAADVLVWVNAASTREVGRRGVRSRRRTWSTRAPGREDEEEAAARFMSWLARTDAVGAGLDDLADSPTWPTCGRPVLVARS